MEVHTPAGKNDENRDASDTWMFIRGEDCNITEELLDLLPLTVTIMGQDISEGLKMCTENSYTTMEQTRIFRYGQGASNVLCRPWCVWITETKLDSLTSPVYITFWTKKYFAVNVYKWRSYIHIVVKIINFKHARGLNHRQFTSFLVRMESENEKLYNWHSLRRKVAVVVVGVEYNK